MTCISSQNNRPPLRQNPFTTYRDPETGRWVVVSAESNAAANTAEASRQR